MQFKMKTILIYCAQIMKEKLGVGPDGNIGY